MTHRNANPRARGHRLQAGAKLAATSLLALAIAGVIALGRPVAGATRAGVENLKLSATVRAELVAAATSADDLPRGSYIGLLAHESYDAYDATTNTYWAGAAPVPNPHSLAAQVSAQDDGDYRLFWKRSGRGWSEANVGMTGVGGTTCPVVVPAAVLAVWGWAPHSCRPQ